MAQIGIVTDSTASMPAELVERHEIEVVPQVLNWEGETMFDGIDITSEQFYQRLATAEEMPTTSQATIAGFKEAFEKLHGQGRPILTICLSEKLSGTLQSARQAQELVPEAEVTIIDSNTVAMALGFQVKAAARAAEKGATLAEAAAEVERVREQVGLVFVLETMEFLHRGGRIGGAARLAGAALNIKPILGIIDGRVEPLDRVRTMSKATNRLLELLEERVEGADGVQIAYHHTGADVVDEELVQRVQERLPVSEFHQSVFTPVVGTHAGPGAFGFAYCTAV